MSETPGISESLPPAKIAVLISGGGTTLLNLIQHIERDQLPLQIAQVVSSNPQAKGLKHADDNQIPAEIVTLTEYPDRRDFSNRIFEICRNAGVKLIVMGGFLKQVAVPPDFENRIVNIHPSLIPAFCGEGFYGQRVHRAVLDYGAKLSGCTVHFVDDHYDHGPIIAQQAVVVQDDDTPETLAARVFEAECELYPKVIAAVASGKVHIDGRRISIA